MSTTDATLGVKGLHSRSLARYGSRQSLNPQAAAVPQRNWRQQRVELLTRRDGLCQTKTMETNHGKEKTMVKTWHIHPETGAPHPATECSMLSCTIETVWDKDMYRLVQGAEYAFQLWTDCIEASTEMRNGTNVLNWNVPCHVGTLRSIRNGTLRFVMDGKVEEFESYELDSVVRTERS